MKIYRGRRRYNGCRVLVNNRRLPLRLDLRNHSASGFEWGYEGSGPAQLAVAILADFLRDDDTALRLHQPFKRDIIAHLPVMSWEMSEEVVASWCMSYHCQPPEFQADLPFLVDGIDSAIKAGDL
jgi:Family of unknown function (DUF6166)